MVNYMQKRKVSFIVHCVQNGPLVIIKTKVLIRVVRLSLNSKAVKKKEAP